MTLNLTEPRLDDVQRLLLFAAIIRPDGSLLPPPSALGHRLNTRIRKAIGGLISCGFAQECETERTGQYLRIEGEARFGIFITSTGRAAIVADELTIGAPSETCTLAQVPSADPAKSKPASKIGNVITLLSRAEGATLPELTEVTNWLPHTMRAALTGLRKKGYTIERSPRADGSCWHIAARA